MGTRHHRKPGGIHPPLFWGASWSVPLAFEPPLYGGTWLKMGSHPPRGEGGGLATVAASFFTRKTHCGGNWVKMGFSCKILRAE